MNEYEQTLMQLCLSKKGRAANLDSTIFKKWANGNISTEECKQQFFENNKTKDEFRSKVNDNLFIEWLSSLGWRRRK